MVDSVYILDNGAHSVKVGFSSWKKPKIVPNCIMKAKSEKKRLFVGDQIKECRDASGLYYILPYQKGLLMNWDIQKTVWDYIFSKECCSVSFPTTPVVMTEPYFNFASIQDSIAEIFFEEYDVQSYLRICAGDLAAYHYRQDNPEAQCCLIIDSGYSFTHIAPYIKGKKYKKCIKRIDVGGKLLTNHLKEIISYSDETNTSLSETIRIGAFAENRKTVQPELVMPEVPFSRLLRQAQAVQPMQKELPVEPIQPNKLDTENGNIQPNQQQQNDDFIMLDLKTPFAGCNGNSELGVFYRECQSAPPLQGTETGTLAEQLGDLTRQLEIFETSFRQYDSVITRVCSQENNN